MCVVGIELVCAKCSCLENADVELNIAGCRSYRK